MIEVRIYITDGMYQRQNRYYEFLTKYRHSFGMSDNISINSSHQLELLNRSIHYDASQFQVPPYIERYKTLIMNCSVTREYVDTHFKKWISNFIGTKQIIMFVNKHTSLEMERFIYNVAGDFLEVDFFGNDVLSYLTNDFFFNVIFKSDNLLHFEKLMFREYFNWKMIR